ncbi:craniofacial development protein 1 isoform X2 [Suricata suricatta]|uniref:BCAR1 scaffold protein, Cas family member n=1 Tax=Suricata suricatta TaxID=37032 RepID=A0A673UUQ6_SURSU|nr:craniofacial development protein 1 isoform X2 [Suricata suricatta]
MEEFDSEDFSTSEEDEDYVPSGGEYSEDDVNELVKEDEVDGEEQTQKTKGKKRKAQSIPARKRKQGGLSLEEDAEDASEDSEGGSSEEDGAAARQEKGVGSDDARKKKEDELWASFLNDVGPKPKVPPDTQVKSGEKTEEMSSSKLLVRTEELEKPKETEKVKITKVFDFAGEEVRVTKEVDATSKEAKSFFKQNEKEKPQAAGPAAVSPLPAGSGKLSLMTACGIDARGERCVSWTQQKSDQRDCRVPRSDDLIVKKIKRHDEPFGENWSQEAEDEHPREVQIGLGELQGGRGHW